VLNCLGEKSADPIMKHFLKRFAAGEDRFQVSLCLLLLCYMCFSLWVNNGVVACGRGVCLIYAFCWYLDVT
jgi:hypothetical protein